MVKKILIFLFLVITALVAGLLIIGTIKQSAYDAEVLKEHQPTGKFSNVNNHRIHYSYTGNGDVTFIMIAGLGETMHTWKKVQDQLAKRGQVFMYDRSGLGFSEEGSLPRSVAVQADELYKLVKNENIPGPYILIGHSAGGFIARYYANKYPQDIAGLFLIDPYAEKAREETGEWPITYQLINWSLRKLSWSGIPFSLLPDPPHPIYKTSVSLKTFGYEAFSENVSLGEFKQLSTASDIPVYLLTAKNTNPEYFEKLKKWHQEIVDKYTNDLNKHVVIESGHHIHIEQTQSTMEELDEFLTKLGFASAGH